MSRQTAMAKAETYLLDRLTGSGEVTGLADTRVYRGKAPADSDFPLVVYNYHAGSYQKVVGGDRFISRLIYSIRAISRLPSTIADEADQIAAAFDVLLENDSASPVLLVECQSPIVREYVLDGVSYEERGGLYRILVQGG